jgi:hypothetical protein
MSQTDDNQPKNKHKNKSKLQNGLRYDTARTGYELTAIALVIIGSGTAIGAYDAVREDGGSWLLGDSHIQRG